MLPLAHFSKEYFDPADALLRDHAAKLQGAAKARRSWEEMLAQNAPGPKREKAHTELTTAATKAASADCLLRAKMELMEFQRVKDMKDLLSEYLHGCMMLHCKALESYSRVMQRVNALDPDDALRVRPSSRAFAIICRLSHTLLPQRCDLSFVTIIAAGAS